MVEMPASIPEIGPNLRLEAIWKDLTEIEERVEKMREKAEEKIPKTNFLTPHPNAP
jgi:hypothetical protein